MYDHHEKIMRNNTKADPRHERTKSKISSEYEGNIDYNKKIEHTSRQAVSDMGIDCAL